MWGLGHGIATCNEAKAQSRRRRSDFSRYWFYKAVTRWEQSPLNSLEEHALDLNDPGGFAALRRPPVSDQENRGSTTWPIPRRTRSVAALHNRQHGCPEYEPGRLAVQTNRCYDVIAAVIDDLFALMRADSRFERFGAGRSLDSRRRPQHRRLWLRRVALIWPNSRERRQLSRWQHPA